VVVALLYRWLYTSCARTQISHAHISYSVVMTSSGADTKISLLSSPSTLSTLGAASLVGVTVSATSDLRTRMSGAPVSSRTTSYVTNSSRSHLSGSGMGTTLPPTSASEYVSRSRLVLSA